MRDERPRRGAGGDRLHHRRFDLEKIPLLEKAPDDADDARALLEQRLDIGVDHEIDVALAVARLDVGEAVPLLGQRPQALREQLQPGRLDRQLLRLGAEELSPDTDDVAQIELLEKLVGLVADAVAPHVDLNASSAPSFGTPWTSRSGSA